MKDVDELVVPSTFGKDTQQLALQNIYWIARGARSLKCSTVDMTCLFDETTAEC
jgi:hypothetical protein